MKQLLETEQALTVSEVEALTNQANELLVDREHIEYDGEANMDAGSDFDREQVKEQIERLDEKVLEIKDALAMVAEGSYGRCGNCYERIPKDRMRFQVPAFLCIDCRRLY
jgi:DnaK suppressor protein